MGTRTLADEVRAAQAREPDDAVLRRWNYAQIRTTQGPLLHKESRSRESRQVARDILAGMRWRRPVVPVWGMTDAQQKAALGVELKRLRGGDDDGTVWGHVDADAGNVPLGE
jgi:hypothetical protein